LLPFVFKEKLFCSISKQNAFKNCFLIGVGEDVGKKEPMYTAVGNAN
jgi:hypothetical protein